MIGAIIPAAGASTRMGFPKALLTYRGVSFLSGILAAAHAAGIERRVVVLGFASERVRAAADADDVQFVMTEDYAAGPIGSIRAGIRALFNHPVEGAIVWAVDRPHVQVSTIQALAAGFAGRSTITVPLYRGERGHPVVFGRDLFQELLESPATGGARVVVRRDPGRVHTVPVDDPAVIEDLNTPADYEALVRREDGHRSGA